MISRARFLCTKNQIRSEFFLYFLILTLFAVWWSRDLNWFQVSFHFNISWNLIRALHHLCLLVCMLPFPNSISLFFPNDTVSQSPNSPSSSLFSPLSPSPLLSSSPLHFLLFSLLSRYRNPWYTVIHIKVNSSDRAAVSDVWDCKLFLPSWDVVVFRCSLRTELYMIMA